MNIKKISVLKHIQRPTHLYIGIVSKQDQFKYYDEKVFLPFLILNEHNIIDTLYEEIDCNDCRNYWIKIYPRLTSRIFNFSCVESGTIDGIKNIEKCAN